MQDSTKRLLAYLHASGTGISKLAQVRAIVDEQPGIGPAALVEEMRVAGLPPGTIAKGEKWMDDPSLVLVPRKQISTLAKVAEAARENNRREEVYYVEPTRSRS